MSPKLKLPNPTLMEDMLDLLEVLNEQFEIGLDESPHVVFTKDEALQIFTNALYKVGSETAKRHMSRINKETNNG